MRGILLAILMFVESQQAFGQLTVPDVVAPYEPIVAGCNCIVPENGKATFMWRTDDNSKYRERENGTQLDIWAPPGTHFIEALVIVQVFQDLEVVVRDPNDPTKTTIQKIKVPISFDLQRYSKNYTVGTAPVPPNPPGPPGPPNPPGPPGPDSFAGEALKWMKAIPTADWDKAKMLKVADIYSGVASQAVATSGMNLDTFRSFTRTQLVSQVGTATLAKWEEPFTRPLSMYQSTLAAQRGVGFSDSAGLAKIWNETSAAIKTAADSMTGSVPVRPRQGVNHG